VALRDSEPRRYSLATYDQGNSFWNVPREGSHSLATCRRYQLQAAAAVERTSPPPMPKPTPRKDLLEIDSPGALAATLHQATEKQPSDLKLSSEEAHFADLQSSAATVVATYCTEETRQSPLTRGIKYQPAVVSRGV